MAGDNYVGTAYTFQARAYDYQLWSWGKNNYGQVGDNTVVYKSSPVQIPGTNWARTNKTTARSDTRYAFKDDNTLWAWGYDVHGLLAQNTQAAHRSSPVQIPGTTWANAANTYNSSTIATKTDGTLWAWGDGDQGMLGQNSRTKYSSPVQIPGTTWGIGKDKFTGSGLSFGAIKTDGTFWTWGYNANGMLGQSNLTMCSSPVQVPGTTWNTTSGGYWSNSAIKTDGTLWTWGWNSSGKLGQNNQTQYSSPKQVPGTTWSSLAFGLYNAAATKTDGTLWAWGNNNYGELGQNSRTYYSSPVQIPGTTWDIIVINNAALAATKTDGTMWSWGNNGNGSLGLNDQTQYSSPVQIPGTTWTNLAGCSNGAMAIKKV